MLLPKTAFFGFAKRYREPKVDEGFQDIVKVEFEVRILQYLGCTSIRGNASG